MCALDVRYYSAPAPAAALCLRTRRGRRTSSPSQFGHTPFKALAQVHPRFHTPALAIVVQAMMAIILLLVGGAFQELLELVKNGCVNALV